MTLPLSRVSTRSRYYPTTTLNSGTLNPVLGPRGGGTALQVNGQFANTGVVNGMLTQSGSTVAVPCTYLSSTLAQCVVPSLPRLGRYSFAISVGTFRARTVCLLLTLSVAACR